MFKLTIEATDVVLVSFLFTLNLFDGVVSVFFADLEHLNARCNTLLP